MDVLILCGLPGSGKSTWYREHLLTTHLLISKDLMPNVKRPAQRQLELLRLALEAHHSVVVDNTNPTPADRVPLIEIAHHYQARALGYFFVASTQQALERNQRRQGKAHVLPVAIYSTAARLAVPTFAEGFDALYYVHVKDDPTALAPMWQIEEISHDE